VVCCHESLMNWGNRRSRHTSYDAVHSFIRYQNFGGNYRLRVHFFGRRRISNGLTSKILFMRSSELY
jgi:hypothetical protein